MNRDFAPPPLASAITWLEDDANTPVPATGTSVPAI